MKGWERVRAFKRMIKPVTCLFVQFLPIFLYFVGWRISFLSLLLFLFLFLKLLFFFFFRGVCGSAVIRLFEKFGWKFRYVRVSFRLFLASSG